MTTAAPLRRGGRDGDLAAVVGVVLERVAPRRPPAVRAVPAGGAGRPRSVGRPRAGHLGHALGRGRRRDRLLVALPGRRRGSPPRLTGLVLSASVGLGLAVLAGRLARARAGRRRRGRGHPPRRRAGGGARGGRSPGPRRRTPGARLLDALQGRANRHRHRRGLDCRRIVPNRAFAAMLGVAPGQNISQTARRCQSGCRCASTRPMAPPCRRGTGAAARRPHRAAGARRRRRRRAPRRRPHLAVRVRRAAARRRGRPRGAIGAFLDVSSRRRASEEQRFLAEATRLLNGSLDYQDTLAQAGAAGGAQQADWSLLDMLDDHGEVVRVGLAHRDPVKEAALTQALVMTPAGQGIRGQRGLLNLVKPAARCCGPTSRARASSARGSARIRSSSSSRWA